MTAVSISRFLLVYFGAHFENGTCTILGNNEAKYGPGMTLKTVLSITGERCSIYKRQSNRLIRILHRKQRALKHLRDVCLLQKVLI